MQAEVLPEAELGHEWEWERTPEITLKIVDDVDHAAALFNRYSPQFVASLLSDDAAEHERFYAAVNAPFVGDDHTRWVDGQKALRKPELGLSNWQAGRLFGRGGILSGDSVYTVRTRARTTSAAQRALPARGASAQRPAGLRRRLSRRTGRVTPSTAAACCTWQNARNRGADRVADHDAHLVVLGFVLADERVLRVVDDLALEIHVVAGREVEHAAPAARHLLGQVRRRCW